jgi:hypothetical protein
MKGMSIVYSENATHRQNLIAAENTRVAAYAAAAGSQSAIKSADIAYARSALASAKANSCGVEQWQTMLKELGVTGA